MNHSAKSAEDKNFLKSGPATPETAEWWELVVRIAHSNAFARSQRLRDFLLYIGACAVEKRTEEITEQQIGVHVFGRPADYSPGEDNIVRATARMLRLRLRDYFETEGAGERWRIEIPKGAYIPAFIENIESSGAALPAPRRYPRRLWLAAAAVLGLVAVLLFDNIRLRIAKPAGREPALWDSVFSGRGPIQVVLPDGSLGIINGWIGSTYTVEEYVARRPWETPTVGGISQDAEQLRSTLAASSMVGFETVNVVFRILKTTGRLDVRYPRSLQTRDFKNEDTIILGGPRSNPWGRLFDAGLNFQMESADASSMTVIRNRQPKAGEPQTFISVVDARKSGRAYARIAMVPSLSGNARVLLLAGTTADGTEAAGEFLLDPKAFRELPRPAGGRRIGDLERFEILLETTAIAGAPKSYRVVGYRW